MRDGARAYDEIGRGYAEQRVPDVRLQAAIAEALGDARLVVNVGAGAGSYEPADRRVVAVEPSALMQAQRLAGAAPGVRARAEALPFAAQQFDAALAVLTVHHWRDRAAGLRELARVARRQVLLLWDPDFGHDHFWLVNEYFPEIADLDADIHPTQDDLREAFGKIDVRRIEIPYDCTDGFLCAYWRRPSAYLDPDVRRAISCFAKIDDPTPGLHALARDLATRRWERRHRKLLVRPSLDLGYRLVVAGQ